MQKDPNDPCISDTDTFCLAPLLQQLWGQTESLGVKSRKNSNIYNNIRLLAKNGGDSNNLWSMTIGIEWVSGEMEGYRYLFVFKGKKNMRENCDKLKENPY